MRRPLGTIAFVLAIMFGSAGVASADPEWCDYGSPPPNDFRHRPTGPGSFDSSLGWLNSTTGGTLDLANGVNTLTGGVAHGMRQALLNSRPWSSLPARGARDDD